MSILEITLIVLFVLFFAGTVLRVVSMLERKRTGGDVERARLVFFFLGCLMLVCMIPLRLFELLTGPVLGADLGVVASNFVGYALTYDRWRRRGGKETPDPSPTVRVYQVYFRGQPLGLISKEGIDVLLAHKLLKRQHTVELVEDFEDQARRKGIGITLLRSRDGEQVLVRVQPPGGEPTEAGAPE